MEAGARFNEASGSPDIPLDKSNADALHRCIRILGSDKTAAARVTMSAWARDFVRAGCWPLFRPDELPELFYPADADRAASLRELIAAARIAGRLPDLIGASHLAAWADCPKLPVDSPLRAWLPASMHE